MCLDSSTRVEILRCLNERKYTAPELSRRLQLSKTTVYVHLKKMQRAGLVEKIKVSKQRVYYVITPWGRDQLRRRDEYDSAY